METFRNPDQSVSATYMTQAEANEVMELWAARQREDAARQSLITVHDVAEATQLSAQEVERLLNEVRISNGPVRRESVRVSGPVLTNDLQSNPSLRAAWRKVAPWSALVAVLIGIYMDTGPDRFGDHARNVADKMLVYGVLMEIWLLGKFLVPKIREAFQRITATPVSSQTLRD